MLNLESLRIFVMAADTENFSRAAQHLHISQPSVSQHIQLLEQNLGIELFERHGRRISLSAAGAALLPLVQDLLRTSRQVEEAALALKGEVVGHLTIGCSTASGKYVLPRLLAELRDLYPLVRATVNVGSRPQVIEWLLAGEVDLAVSSDRVQRGGLHYRRFFEDEIVMVAPSDHPWTIRGKVSPRDLYDERFILRDNRSGTHATLLEGLDQIGIDINRLETVLVLDNSEAIVMAVQEGIGLGFVPKVCAQCNIGWAGVATVHIEGLRMRRWLHLADNSHLPQTPALSAFLGLVDGKLPVSANQAPKELAANLVLPQRLHKGFPSVSPELLPVSPCE